MSKADLAYAKGNDYFHLHQLNVHRGGYYLEVPLKHPNLENATFAALGHTEYSRKAVRKNSETVRLLRPGYGYVGKGREVEIPVRYQREFGPIFQQIGASLQAQETQNKEAIDCFLYHISPILMSLIILDYGPKLLPLPEVVEQTRCGIVNTNGDNFIFYERFIFIRYQQSLTLLQEVSRESRVRQDSSAGEKIYF